MTSNIFGYHTSPSPGIQHSLQLTSCAYWNFCRLPLCALHSRLPSYLWHFLEIFIMKKRSLKIWWTAVLFCAFGTTRLFADFTITNFDNSSTELLGTAATSGTSAVLVYDRSQVGGLFTTSTCDVDAVTVAFTFRVITPSSFF